MERNIPAAAAESLNEQTSGEVYLVFLTVTHPHLDEVIRVVTDTVDYELDGENYIGVMFDISLLTDNEEMPTAQLTIQNVDRRMGDILLRADEPARLTIELIASSLFDLTVDPRVPLGTIDRIYTAQYLYLTSVECNAMTLTGAIQSWNYIQEPYPGLFATEDRIPGLYR